MLEAAEPNRRGLTLSWQRSSQTLAQIVGGLVGLTLTAALPAEALEAYGWRIAFLLGAVAVPFGLWLRTSLPETLQSTEEDAAESRLAQARGSWRIVVLGLVVLAGATINANTFTYTVTYVQATLQMSARSGFIIGILTNVIAIPAALLGGWLSDRHGRRPINIWGNLLFLLTIYPVFAWIEATRSELVLFTAMTALSAVANFYIGSMFASLAEGLPKTIRSASFGTVFAISIAAFGGTTPIVLTWLIHQTGSPMAPAWYLIGATAIAQIGYLLIPESEPSRLRPPSASV